MIRRIPQEQPYTHAESRFPTQEGKDTSWRVCKRPGCLKPFPPVKTWQVFCCPECRHRYWKDIRETASKMAAEQEGTR
jgi:hypothetical protein